MGFNYKNFIFKKDNFSLIIIQFLLLILSLIFGSVLFLMILKYLNNINILNTFFIIICIYFFQLVFEFIKYFMIYIKFNRLNRSFSGFIKNFKFKFLIVNLCFFILSSLVVFGCLLGSLFFSNFKILFIFIMGILLGGVYLFYTCELINLLGCEIFKQDKQNLIVLVLINALVIILLINVFYLFKYLGILIFIFISLANLFLFHLNYRNLIKK